MVDEPRLYRTSNEPNLTLPNLKRTELCMTEPRTNFEHQNIWYYVVISSSSISRGEYFAKKIKLGPDAGQKRLPNPLARRRGCWVGKIFGFIIENWVTMTKIAQKCPIFLLCLRFSNVREPFELFLSNLERTEPVIKVTNRTNIEHRFEVHPPLKNSTKVCL